MRNNVVFSDDQLKSFLNQLYSCFENGYEFEVFLKVYLEKIGLDEVVVTQKSSDGGIDLKAIRNSVVDVTEYYVQAKRYKPGNSVKIESVRALRGVLKEGVKGVFITTGKFTKATVEEVEKYNSRPIILIDGMRLIESCIDKNLGFVYTPVFSETEIKKLLDITDDLPGMTDNSFISVEKQISLNDIRAKILRLPKVIIDSVDSEIKFLNVIFDKQSIRKLNIDKSRTFLSGITELYRKSGLLELDGTINPCKAIWKKYEDRVEIEIKKE